MVECKHCGVLFDRLNQGEYVDAGLGNTCNDCLAYEVKGVVTGIGHDLAGWKATLYCNDKKVAIVNDDGYGGCLDFHWIDWKTGENQKVFEKFITRAKAFQESLGEKSPYWHRFEPMEGSVMFDDEMYLHSLVDKFETDKMWKKLCKKGVVFQEGDCVGSKDTYRIIKGESYYKPKFDEWAEKHYPGQKIRVLNEEYGINVFTPGAKA